MPLSYISILRKHANVKLIDIDINIFINGLAVPVDWTKRPNNARILLTTHVVCLASVNRLNQSRRRQGFIG